MAITNWNNFIAAGTQTPWYATALEDALKGYKMAKEPAKMAEEAKQKEATLKQTDIANKTKQFELEKAPEKFSQESRYKEALMQQAKAAAEKSRRPPAIQGALSQAQQLRDLYPVGSQKWTEADDQIKKLNTISNGAVSPLAKLQAERKLTPEGSIERQQYDDLIKKTTAQSKGIQVSTNADGTQIQIGGKDEGLSVPGVGKLKQGSVVVYNKEGKVDGINEPYTPKELEKEVATRQFGVAYPFLNKSLSYYSGQGSNLRFENDILNYTTDPAAKARIDNYDAAKQLMSVTSTAENARIGGHATDLQIKSLKKALDSAELNERLVQSKGYQLPLGYKEASGNIFNGKLDEINKAGKNIPYWRFRPINEKQAKAVEANKKLSSAIKKHEKEQSTAGRTYNLATRQWE